MSRPTATPRRRSRLPASYVSGREAAVRSAQALASPGGVSILARAGGTATPSGYKRRAFNGTACARLDDSDSQAGDEISVPLVLA
jgi:hypothetical protein